MAAAPSIRSQIEASAEAIASLLKHEGAIAAVAARCVEALGALRILW